MTYCPCPAPRPFVLAPLPCAAHRPVSRAWSYSHRPHPQAPPGCWLAEAGGDRRGRCSRCRRQDRDDSGPWPGDSAGERRGECRNAWTAAARLKFPSGRRRSEEHTSELQSLMRISYAVFCLKKKTEKKNILVNKNNHRQQTDSGT